MVTLYKNSGNGLFFLEKKGIIAWPLNLNITCQHLVKLQIFMYHLFFSKLD